MSNTLNQPWSTIQEHLHQIGKTNRAGVWVPHNLSEENKANRSTICNLLIQRYNTEAFFDRLITGDEKWVLYENLKRKRQWLSVNELPQSLAKPGLHPKKALLCVWWSIRGVIYFEVLKHGITVNADLYCEQLDRHFLSGKKFENLDVVQNAISSYFTQKPISFYQSRIENLRSRWQKVVENEVCKHTILQILVLVNCGVCFCCFDNLLGLLNLHTAGQFKILQRRLKSILKSAKETDVIKTRSQRVYKKLRECVLMHHELIWYSEKMEQVFKYTTLCQLLVSSVMLCVAGFQVFLARGTFVRRLIFIAHTNGCFNQLFVVTLTSNDLMVESRAVGDAAYNANWQTMSHKENKGVRKAILMIMMRSTHACSISAGGFFPVSLETFMAVLSTAASYFTLLRKFVD
ncbi:odorant receptor Or2-like [Cardiocondyla obscurior]|uniref:odorant receptor Or2-like n=1 Tax=Cardiocondyla obscurior TaxID=286306 RepID=UPI0039656E5E